MNFKKVLSLSFVFLFATASVAFPANNTRNVYSVYSDNFNGAHFYGVNDNIPESDTDAIKFDIWEDQWTPGGTMTSESVESSAGDLAPEGNRYMRFKWKQYTWAGCGYTRKKGTTTNANIDMSAYAGGTIKFSVRSTSSAVLQNCEIGFSIVNSGTEVQKWQYLKNLSGFDSTSTTWQELTYNIPTGTSLSQVRSFFIVRQTANVVQNDTLDIDNIRWVKSAEPAEFSVIRKKVSDNSEVSDQTTPISFSEDTFGQGWAVADQYLELDIDGDLGGNNWKVRFYTNNDKEGLYNIADTSDVLPTAWKISCSTLPYTNYDGSAITDYNSLEIGENWAPDGETLYGLYDAGKVRVLGEGAKTWYPWFFVKAKDDSSQASIVWQNVPGNPSQSGCHTFENTDAGGVTTQYYDALTDFYERKPKLFFACNTGNAKASKYTASFIISLSYE